MNVRKLVAGAVIAQGLAALASSAASADVNINTLASRSPVSAVFTLPWTE